MLEYGIKTITTNPTLITKATEIIRLIDSRNHQTRAFVLPVSFEPLIEKLVKELKYKKWVEEKKKNFNHYKNEENELETIMSAGIESMNHYLKENE